MDKGKLWTRLKKAPWGTTGSRRGNFNRIRERVEIFRLITFPEIKSGTIIELAHLWGGRKNLKIEIARRNEKQTGAWGQEK
jgi:hypothetical protein